MNQINHPPRPTRLSLTVTTDLLAGFCLLTGSGFKIDLASACSGAMGSDLVFRFSMRSGYVFLRGRPSDTAAKTKNKV